MAKIDPATVTKKMYALLKGATPAERHRIVTATLTLFDEALVPATGASGTASGTPAATPQGSSVSGITGDSIRAFFDAKQPKTKLDQLAVAARYREQHNSSAHTKEDFKAALKGAKRAFDERNFKRDLDSAKKAKLFNTGSDNQLSYYGEQYVELLPDRKAARALKRPGKLTKKSQSKKR